MRIKLRIMLCLQRPHGHEVAVLRSFRPMNRAQEPRLRGGSSVAVALHATAGLASNRFSAGCRLSLMRMGEDAPLERLFSGTDYDPIIANYFTTICSICLSGNLDDSCRETLTNQIPAPAAQELGRRFAQTRKSGHYLPLRIRTAQSNQLTFSTMSRKSTKVAGTGVRRTSHGPTNTLGAMRSSLDTQCQ